jgi:hypothetical protein
MAQGQFLETPFKAATHAIAPRLLWPYNDETFFT